MVEELPYKSGLVASGIRSSGFLRSISGSGKQYGASSIRFPSLKQSSNLDQVSAKLVRDSLSGIPMWQNNLAFDVLCDRDFTLFRI